MFLHIEFIQNFNKMMNQHRTKILCAVALTDLIAIGLVVPLAGAHLRSLGMSHFLIGLLGSAYAALQLFTSPIIGSWSDIRGHRIILMETMAICSICYLFWGFTTSITTILIIRLLLGTFKHTQTLCKALIADSVPQSQHSEVFGNFNAIGGIGFMIGPAVGGHLAEFENGFFYICLMVALSFCFNIALVYICISDEVSKNLQDTYSTKKDDHETKTLKNKSLKTQLLSSFLLLKSIDWSQFWDIFTLKFLLGFSQALFYSTYGLYIQELFGIGPRWVGYTISFQGMVGALSSFLMGYLDKFYSKDPTYNVRMLHGFIVLSLSFCILGLAPNLNWFLIGLVPLSASGALLRVVGMEILLYRTDGDKRGSLMGSSNSISSIARLVGPVCSGLIRDLAGAHAVFIFIILICGSGVIVTLHLLNKGEHKKYQ